MGLGLKIWDDMGFGVQGAQGLRGVWGHGGLPSNEAEVE